MIKAQEYKKSPLSPRSRKIRLQKRLKAVELSFASTSPAAPSSSSSASPLDASKQILVNQTISESLITSPSNSQSLTPPPLTSSSHSKSSFECVKPIVTPDDGLLTDADINKMLDEEADIYPPYREGVPAPSFQSADANFSEDEGGIKLADIISAWDPRSLRSTNSSKLQEDMDVTLDEDENDVRVVDILSPWEASSLKNTAPNKLIAESYHGRRCKKMFIRSIGLIPISEVKQVDDKTVVEAEERTTQPLCVVYTKTADPIRDINNKPKSRAASLKAVESVQGVNKRSKKSGVQKQRRVQKPKRQPYCRKVKKPSDKTHDCITRILYSTLMGRQYSAEDFDSMYSDPAKCSDIDEAIMDGIIFDPKIRKIWSRGCRHF